MLGTVVNALAIVVGGTIGTVLRRGISTRFKETAIWALGLAVLFLGLQKAWDTANPLIMISSLVVGGLIGEGLNLEKWLNFWAKKIEGVVGGKGGNVGEALVTTTLIYCVGAMAIMGSLQSGLTGDHSMLYAKSMLDGISSVFFASTLGAGVILSAVPVFLYQSSITIGARWASVWLTPAMIAEMTAVGGLLIFAIGLSILDIKRVRVANLLPAVLVAAVLAAVI